MKVKLHEIPVGGELTLTEGLDPSAMNLNTPELRFTGPLGVSATFRREPEAIWVEVGVAGRLEQVCGRCLESCGRSYDERFRLDYSVKGMRELDITGDVRQEVVLSYPVRFLCREDCQGLCPQCGTNLNERRCVHGAS